MLTFCLTVRINRGNGRMELATHDLKTARRLGDGLTQIISLAEASLIGSNDREITNELVPYLGRYHIDAEEEQLQKIITNQWLDDLSEFPPDLIKLACKNWRMNDKRGWPAKAAGQLMASVQPILSSRRRILNRARDIKKILKYEKENEVSADDLVTADKAHSLERMVGEAAIKPYSPPKREQSETDRERALERRKAEFLASIQEPN